MGANGNGARGTASALSYMPQLDGLRALAVMGVFTVHFLPGENAVRAMTDWGMLGVRLFFVLSGFLITGILLSCRAKTETGEVSRRRTMSAFYARRFLRLFPLYYLYLLAAVTVWPEARERVPWFLAYGQNFLFALEPEAMGLMTHFWTLAIEEQFYLTWPWLVLLTPRRFLLPAMLGVVVCGPLFRTVGLAAGLTGLQVGMMMPAHFDTLGMGGLLALLSDPRYGYRPHAERLLRVGLWAGAPLIVVYSVFDHYTAFAGVRMLIGEISAGLFFVWVVGRAATGFTGPAGAVLAARPVVYCGTISYGLYVIHYHVPGLLREKILPRLGMGLSGNDGLDFILFAAVSIALAAISWHLYEKPLNRLKRYFPYTARRRSLGRKTAADASSTRRSAGSSTLRSTG